MKCNPKSLTVLSLFAIAGASFADPTIDGHYDAEYGAVAAAQLNQTNFGKASNGTNFADGNQMDGMYVRRTATDLYVFLPGNYSTDYTPLVVFFDTLTGGQNRMLNNQTPWSFGKWQAMGESGANVGDGLTFAKGFNADWGFLYNNGDSGSQVFNGYFDFVPIGDPDTAHSYYLGNISSPAGPDLTGGDKGTDLGVKGAIDNTNTVGVEGGSGLAANTTPNLGANAKGFEVKIPLSTLGLTGNDALVSPVRVFSMIGATYISNQTLPSLGGVDNLGDPRLVNFQNLISGQGYVLVPGANGVRKVSGKINFGGGLVARQLDAQFRDTSGTNVGQAQAMELTDNGDGSANFTVWAPGSANFQMCVKPKGFLSRMAMVNTSGGDVSGVNMTLMLGDIDGDDTVTVFDYGVLSDYFDKSNSDADWYTVGGNGFAPADADLDGDGAITVFDYGYISDNFDKNGDCA